MDFTFSNAVSKLQPRINFVKARHTPEVKTAPGPVVVVSNPQKKATVKIEDLVLPVASKWISRLDVESMLRWQSVGGPTRGLHNLGNTCFMNSTLQCLATTPTLMQYLASQEHSSSCRTESCVLCWTEKFFIAMHDPSAANRPISPKWLAANIRVLGRQFRPGRQEDSHEMLRRLLEHCARSVLRNAGVKEGSPGREDETTPLHNIFGGYFRNQVHCPECRYDSNTFDSFMDLSLEVDHSISSVTKALAHFAKPEVLDAQNRWKCPRCSKAVQARKQLSVRLPPAALTVQLKRFSFTPRAPPTKMMMHGGGGGGGNNFFRNMMLASFMGGGMGGGMKLKDHIAFEETLDITPCLSDAAVREGRPPLYRLHGVLVHHGSTVNGGHYFAYTRAPNDQWYCCDDSSVSRVGWNIVKQQMAYILFYSRVPGQPTPVLSGALSGAAAPAPAAATPIQVVSKAAAPKLANGVVVAPSASGAVGAGSATASLQKARNAVAQPTLQQQQPQQPQPQLLGGGAAKHAMVLADLAHVTYDPAPAPASAPSSPWFSTLAFSSTTPMKELNLLMSVCRGEQQQRPQRQREGQTGDEGRSGAHQDGRPAAVDGADASDTARWRHLRERARSTCNVPFTSSSSYIAPLHSDPWDAQAIRRDVLAARGSERDQAPEADDEETLAVAARVAHHLEERHRHALTTEAKNARAEVRALMRAKAYLFRLADTGKLQLSDFKHLDPQARYNLAATISEAEEEEEEEEREAAAASAAGDEASASTSADDTSEASAADEGSDLEDADVGTAARRRVVPAPSRVALDALLAGDDGEEDDDDDDDEDYEVNDDSSSGSESDGSSSGGDDDDEHGEQELEDDMSSSTYTGSSVSVGSPTHSPVKVIPAPPVAASAGSVHAAAGKTQALAPPQRPARPLHTAAALEMVVMTGKRRHGAFDPAALLADNGYPRVAPSRTGGGNDHAAMPVVANGTTPHALPATPGFDIIPVVGWEEDDEGGGAEAAPAAGATATLGGGKTSADAAAPPLRPTPFSTFVSRGSQQGVKRNRWGEDIATGRAPDEEAAARMTESEWTDHLDVGRVKKVKAKSTEPLVQGTTPGEPAHANQYQRVHDDRVASQSALASGAGYRKGGADISHGNGYWGRGGGGGQRYPHHQGRGRGGRAFSGRGRGGGGGGGGWGSNRGGGRGGGRGRGRG